MTFIESVAAGAVRERMETLAPPMLAESWDNVGWQVGHDGARVRGILVTLDVDHAVVEEAVQRGANLIVAHHPMLFRPLRRINPVDYQGRMLRRLLAEEIAVFAAHTNLDAVHDGVNGALAAALNLQPAAPLRPVSGAPLGWGFGAVCEGGAASTEEMARRVRSALGTAHPRVTYGLGAPEHHRRVALLGGSGASLIEDVLAAGCTLFITGEVKYHEAQDAARAGLSLIEAGHWESERPVLDWVTKWLAPLGVPVHASTHPTSPFDDHWKEYQS